MRTLTLITSSLFLSAFLFLSACKKSADPTPTPTPTPPRPDTLTTGWSKITVPNGDFFEDVFFNSNTTGFLINTKSIYRSANGGLTWDSVATFNTNLINIFIAPGNKAFFVGKGSPSVYRTLDFGATFTTINTGSNTPWDVYFTDNTNGFLLASNGLYASADGGTTWNLVNTPYLNLTGGVYESLYFSDPVTGVIPTGSKIYRCNGSIQNWQFVPVNTGGSYTPNFQNISVPSANVIYVSSEGGMLYKSTDGGASFNFVSNLNVPGSPGFMDIHFLTDLIGYASYSRYIFKTTDGGLSWTKVVSLGEDVISEIHFTDAGHGWACGTSGTVLIFKP